ncbi:MAG: nuclear transport factor 2 family protein [Burkholderiaceae bacterium]|nr:nuclear transport factor 2 family protein [Burkholderiaceae bacterium]
MRPDTFHPGLPRWPGLLQLLLALAAPLAAMAPVQAKAAPAADCSAGASLTAANRAIVEDFVRLFYAERDVRRAFETHVSASQYIQHNPGLPDGREAAIVALTPMFQSPSFEVQPLRIIVDGELAVVHLKVRSARDPRGAAVVDMFRLRDGKIVEHWDVLQVVPENPVSKHPMF